MKKVLLVNDCKFESIIMKDILKDMGYEVKISNEYAALEDVKSYNPEIIICNLIMKHITGDHIISESKKINFNIKGILSSSNDLELEDYKENKVDAIIKTPISKIVLEDLINSFYSDNSANMVKEKKENTGFRKFMFCPYCGEKLNEKFKFCPQCGQKI